MIALVTGVEGFVGPYLVSYLKAQGITTIGTYFAGQMPEPENTRLDVTSLDQTRNIISRIRPDLIFHLAGFSSVALSFTNPFLCKKINVEGTRNILQSVSEARLKARILVIGSAEVYGKPQFLPITEKHPISPESPYAESRVEQERECLGFIKKCGLYIVLTRSFNHSGPGQSDSFVLSSFAKQVALIEKGKQESVKVGNLDAIRDFSDVRDVVRAYFLLLKKAKKGEIYNVCSGKGHSIKDLLGLITKQAYVNVKIETDPTRLRPSDIPVLVGENRALFKRTRWQNSIPIEKTLGDLLQYWRERV